ncbi:hypothetical protein DJ56_4255 [Yersinia pestis]|nr:hypothetical protein DJ56_4255 [Yersinia pestis]
MKNLRLCRRIFIYFKLTVVNWLKYNLSILCILLLCFLLAETRLNEFTEVV